MNPRKERTPFAVVGGCICDSCCTLSGSGPMRGGFRLDGSKTTLNPDTILDGLAAKNFEMDYIQPYSMHSVFGLGPP